MSNSSIWPIDRCSITGASPSYPGYSLLVGGLPFCRDTVGVLYSPSRLARPVKINHMCNNGNYSSLKCCDHNNQDEDGGRDETINHIISQCSKLIQKVYKTRHDWVEKVIHWELCKKLKFDHTNKWSLLNPSWKMRRTKFSGIFKYKRIS